MRPLVPAAAAASTVVVLTGCSVNFDGEWLTSSDLTGTIDAQERSVPDFTSVRTEGDADIEVIAGDEFEVIITADEALQEHILATVKDGELLVRQEYMLWGASDDVEITVTMPECDTLTLVGAGDAYVHGFDEGAFAASLIGSSNLLVVSDFTTIDTEILGSGNITARGTVDTFSVTIAGSGDVHGKDFTAADATVDISGSGDIELRVRESLDVTIAGSGDVTYWGDPALTQRIDGSGDISRGED